MPRRSRSWTRCELLLLALLLAVRLGAAELTPDDVAGTYTYRAIDETPARLILKANGAYHQRFTLDGRVLEHSAVWNLRGSVVSLHGVAVVGDPAPGDEVLRDGAFTAVVRDLRLQAQTDAQGKVTRLQGTVGPHTLQLQRAGKPPQWGSIQQRLANSEKVIAANLEVLLERVLWDTLKQLWQGSLTILAVLTAMVLAGAAAGWVVGTGLRQLGFYGPPDPDRRPDWVWNCLFIVFGIVGFGYAGLWLGVGAAAEETLGNHRLADRVVANGWTAVLAALAGESVDRESTPGSVRRKLLANGSDLEVPPEAWQQMADWLRKQTEGEDALPKQLVEPLVRELEKPRGPLAISEVLGVLEDVRVDGELAADNRAHPIAKLTGHQITALREGLLGMHRALSLVNTLAGLSLLFTPLLCLGLYRLILYLLAQQTPPSGREPAALGGPA